MIRIIVRLFFILLCCGAGLALISCDKAPPAAQKTLQKVTLATPESSLLGYTVHVGLGKGFFKEAGVELSLLDTYPHGKATLQALSSGEADLAVTSEIPFMHAVLDGKKISAFARTLSADKHLAIIGRKDRGIFLPEDLSGKTVGVAPGTSSEYFLDLFMMMHALPKAAIRTVSIKPQGMVQAIVHGAVDAIAVWNPFYSQAEEALAANAASFYSEIGSVMFLIAARQTYLNNNPQLIVHILQGLEKSAQFIQTNRSEADKIVAAATQVEESLLRKLSADYRFEVMLDQSLIKILEDAARWAIDKKLTSATVVPNFLDYVYTAALDDVKPQANEIYTAAPLKIRIAQANQPVVASVLIAQKNGYFKRLGLDVVLQKYGSGKACLQAMLEGSADMSTAGDIPIMFSIMADNKVQILATIENTTKNNAIVARRDRGVLAPKDLVGKKIGVTLGTGAEFFLDSFLLFHEIARSQVQFVPVKPVEMVDALLSGRVDAVSTWNPHLARLMTELEGGGLIFYGEEIYTATQNIVTRQQFLSNNRAAVNKVMRALFQATEFIKKSPGVAQKIVGDEIGMELSQLAAVWDIYNFKLRMDQTLLMTLRDEARWAIKNNLVSRTVIPTFYDSLFPEILKEINPSAVTVER